MTKKSDFRFLHTNYEKNEFLFAKTQASTFLALLKNLVNDCIDFWDPFKHTIGKVRVLSLKGCSLGVASAILCMGKEAIRWRGFVHVLSISCFDDVYLCGYDASVSGLPDTI